MRILVLSVTLLFGTVAFGATPDAAALMRKPTNLPEEELRLALQTLAIERGFQFVYRADLVSGIKTHGAHGNLTMGEALSQLLQGTGLTFSYLGEKAITIEPAGVAPPARQGRAGNQQSNEKRAAGSFSDRFRTAEVAQAENQNAKPSRSIPSSFDQSSSPEVGQIETVVVTGTRIRGVSPAAPVLTFGRSQIESSGYTSVGAFLQALPENFSGGQNPGVIGVEGVNGGENFISQSSSPNLRGIGSDSTLSLVDGHRMGFDGGGENVDISLIPLAAVDRVEVVTDGASAIYGSDAVAGVINIILRKSYDGAQAQATVGGPTDGGGFQQQYSTLVGDNFERGNVIAAYEYDKTDPLYAQQRDFSANAASPLNLLPSQKRSSVFLSGSYEPSSKVALRGVGLYSSKNNFTQVNVLGTLSTLAGGVDQYLINGSADYAFYGDGDLSLDLNYAENAQRLLETDFNPGAPPALTPEKIDSGTESAELELQLPSVPLRTGELRAVVGGGYREERLKEINAASPGSFSRGISYAYGEVYVPLVSPSPTRIGLTRLSADASARYENYERIGTTTNPKIGLIYSPLPDLTLKSSWGTSFRAPSLEQIHQPFTSGLFPGSIFGPPVPPDQTVLIAFGPSPNLRPETSTSWTASADYKPAWLHGLASTLTYYDIRYKERIDSPISSPLTALSDPTFSSFVTLSPNEATQQFYIQQGGFANNTGGPYDPTNVYALVLDGIANVASEKINGVDAQLTYDWSSQVGDWVVGVNGSWLNFARVAVPGAPEEPIAGTIFNPPRFKVRTSVNWEEGGWTAAAYVNYVSGETDNVATPSQKVGSWTTLDLEAGYRFSSSHGFANGLTLRIASQNVLNRAPPHVDEFSTYPFGVGFDAANASGLGRTVLLTVAKDWKGW